jgi:hypothetical protein
MLAEKSPASLLTGGERHEAARQTLTFRMIEQVEQQRLRFR